MAHTHTRRRREILTEETKASRYVGGNVSVQVSLYMQHEKPEDTRATQTEQNRTGQNESENAVRLKIMGKIPRLTRRS